MKQEILEWFKTKTGTAVVGNSSTGKEIYLLHQEFLRDKRHDWGSFDTNLNEFVKRDDVTINEMPGSMFGKNIGICYRTKFSEIK
jgi:hypothetical protein